MFGRGSAPRDHERIARLSTGATYRRTIRGHRFRRSVMCGSYGKEFRRDARKDATRETDKRLERRVKAKDFKFWAFPWRRREFTVKEPEKAPDRTGQKV